MLQTPSSPKLTPARRALVILRQCVDSDYYPNGVDAVKNLPDAVDFNRCLSFIVLHAGCIGVIWVGWSKPAIITAIALYFIRMFAVTGFYHRYFSHRTFRTSRLAQFFFAVFTGTTVQRGALWWASTHRHHHKHSDHEEDIHSPIQSGFWWAHIGWMTSSRNFPTDYSRIKDLAKFPELVFLNRFDLLVPVLFAISLCGFGSLLHHFEPSWGATGPQMLVWGFFISTVFLLHGTLFINSLAHVFGTRRFETEDTSRNSFLLALITLGEGWHNNHHRYMSSVRQGFYWWEIDVTFYLLTLLSWTGIIWDLKPVPESAYEEARAGVLKQAAL